jgi:hypothetical protein
MPRLSLADAAPPGLAPAGPALQARAHDQGLPDSPPPYTAFLATDPAAMPAAWSPSRTNWSLASYRRAHVDGQTSWIGVAAGWSGAQLALLAAALVLGAPLLLTIGLRRVTPLRGPPSGAAFHPV